MKIVLREAGPGDEPHLLAVYGATREDELAMTDWDEARKREFVEQQFRAQDLYYRANYANATYQVILVDGQPGRPPLRRPLAGRDPDHGHRAAEPVSWPWRRDPPARRSPGRGAAPGKPLRIHVERFNPALSLYARLGFRLVEDRGVYLFLEWSPDGMSSAARQPRRPRSQSLRRTRPRSGRPRRTARSAR